MRILLTNSTDMFAGGEDYVLILARYLRERGHAADVAALPGHLLLEKCAAAGLPVHPVDFTGMHRVAGVGRTIGSILASGGFDLVHSNANYDRTASAIGALLARVPHVAGVHSAHSIRHNITHALRNRFGINRFIADAEEVKSVLVEQDGIAPERIVVVPIGVEHDPPAVRAEARRSTRAALGIDDAVLLFGNVARLVPFKGHRYLLDAAAEVVRALPDALFAVVGDGELDGELRAQAERLGIGEHMRFLGFRDDLDRLYPAFDVYCHSSLEMAAEAFPIAILRALAAGLPVVCTAVGGIRMMVEEGVSGHLTPPGDAHALAAGLLHVARDPALRRSMGAASFDLFLRAFHASAMAGRVERVYREALGARAAVT